MSRSAKSVFIFGMYLAVIGLILLFVPNALITPFGIAPTEEVWIRLSGILFMALTVYYVLAAKHEIVVIMKATAFIRMTIIVFFTAFVLLEFVSATILIFAAIDFLGGIWTFFLLKKESHFNGNN
ncbi:MAG TPA: hypothetical protein DIW47_10325 [Bacteroidetes bacterium]|nr:hypothetical protein [Bacteroidota bacterium]